MNKTILTSGIPLNIVLHEPEIPQNTGNIARTCAATGSRLHLIEPLGFSIEDRYMRRAGLDYWERVEVIVHKSYEAFMEHESPPAVYGFTTKASQLYTDISYPEGAYLMFGKETAGLPEYIREAHSSTLVRIPMLDHLRSLNLSNSAAIAVYEVIRQRG